MYETQENLKQANAAIRERDFVITSQREAEKSLVGRAAELRKELEATVQDVAGLFAKIGMAAALSISWVANILSSRVILLSLISPS